MNKWMLLSGFGIAAILTSCSTDFDLNADYQETPVVYGLLNAADTLHYVRVNRAFLSDEVDALTLALDAAAIYYGDELTVTIEEFDGFFNITNSWVLERVDGDTLGLPKDTNGIFATLPNVLYRFTANLNTDRNYRIIARNAETDKVAQGSTALIKDFKILRPNDESIFPQSFVLNPRGVYQFTFMHAANAATYDVVLRFHYRTARYFISGDSLQITSSGEIDWKFATEYNAIDLTTGESVTIDVDGASFFNFLADAFPPDPDIYNIRLADSIQFIVQAGGKAIYDYQLYNASTLGITEGQVTDVFTNVDGGLGLVSTRFLKVGGIYPISIQTKDSIGCSTITAGHNFAPDQTKLGFPFCE